MVMLAGIGVTGSLSGCTSEEPRPVPVNLNDTDLVSWSQSVLEDDDGMSFASRHDGSGETGGSFQNVEPGWYELTMVCVGGSGMEVSVGADGEPVGHGTNGCNSFTTASHIQVMHEADELTVAVTNSGEQMLWAISLVAAPGPPAHPEGRK